MSTNANNYHLSMITIRLAPELHEQLKELAHRHRTSMNQFIVDLLTAEALRQLATKGQE
jgi:predicted HicB family RNase H-like nuclease